MNKTISYLLGCVTGVVATLGFIFIIGLFLRTNGNNKKAQYFTVKYYNQSVRLHTYMPQDSVRILMGEPSDTRFSTIDGEVYETWRYKTADDYGFLELEFSNSELKAVNKY